MVGLLLYLDAVDLAQKEEEALDRLLEAQEELLDRLRLVPVSGQSNEMCSIMTLVDSSRDKTDRKG